VALIVGQLEIFDDRAVLVFSLGGSQVHAYAFNVLTHWCQQKNANLCAYAF
jgi:hypothetical protein